MFSAAVVFLVFSGLIHGGIYSWRTQEREKNERDWRSARRALTTGPCCRDESCNLLPLEECCAGLCTKHCSVACTGLCCKHLSPDKPDGACTYATCLNKQNPNCSAHSCTDHCYSRCENNTWPNQKH
jgi:hypothetical protein